MLVRSMTFNLIERNDAQLIDIRRNYKAFVDNKYDDTLYNDAELSDTPHIYKKVRH